MSSKSANPYFNDDDENPFAGDDARPPAPPAQQQPYQPPRPPPQQPSALRGAAAQNEPTQFYNPTGPTGQAGQHPEYQPAQGIPTQQQQYYQPPPQQGNEFQREEPRRETSRLTTTSKCWKLEFWQQFFDVDSIEVLQRMGNVLVPISPPDFLVHRNWHVRRNGQIPIDTGLEDTSSQKTPDIYGPFWVCTTLWMALAIVGNMMSKLSNSHANKSRVAAGGTLPPETLWNYDFTVALVACATIYGYCFGMSALVWGLMKWKNVPVTLVDTLALYGYSMFIFLLAAILCAIPISGLQWAVCVICGLWSTVYLLSNFWHVWRFSLAPYWFVGVVLLVSTFHLLITMSFKFYFFNYDL